MDRTMFAQQLAGVAAAARPRVIATSAHASKWTTGSLTPTGNRPSRPRALRPT